MYNNNYTCCCIASALVGLVSGVEVMQLTMTVMSQDARSRKELRQTDMSGPSHTSFVKLYLCIVLLRAGVCVHL